MKNRGKHLIDRDFSIHCIQVRERSGRNYLVSISFSLAIGMVLHKVVVLIVVSECELYVLLCEIKGIMCITHLIGSIFFTSFCKYVKSGSGK